MNNFKKGILVGALCGLALSAFLFYKSVSIGCNWDYKPYPEYRTYEGSEEYFKVAESGMDGRHCIQVVTPSVKDCADSVRGFSDPNKVLVHNTEHETDLLYDCLSDPEKYLSFKNNGSDNRYTTLRSFAKGRIILLLIYMIVFAGIGGLIGRAIKRKGLSEKMDL